MCFLHLLIPSARQYQQKSFTKPSASADGFLDKSKEKDEARTESFFEFSVFVCGHLNHYCIRRETI